MENYEEFFRYDTEKRERKVRRKLMRNTALFALWAPVLGCYIHLASKTFA